MQRSAYRAFRDDLIERHAGFRIEIALVGHRSGDRWTGDFTLIQEGAAEITYSPYSYSPYYGSSIFGTREDAKRAALASAKAEIDSRSGRPVTSDNANSVFVPV
jgi:hypothetical protein